MMVGEESDARASVQALSVLWQRKVMIGAVVAGATGLAGLALSTIEPRYTAEALIALNTRAGAAEQLITTKPSVVTPPLTAVVVATELDILKSRGLITQVVDALALDRDAEFDPTLKPSLLPAWLTGDSGKDAHTLTIDTVEKRLWAKSGAESYAIRVGFESENPQKAALIANAFADLYIRNQRQAKLADMHVATDWIAKQIAELRGELARDAAADVSFRRQNKLAPADTRDTGLVASQQMIAINTELAQVQRDRAEAEAALAQARKALKTGTGMTALPFVEDSSFLQEIRKEEAKIMGKLAEMSVGYRQDSPAVAALQGQLSTLRGEINREIAGQVEMLANKAAQARAREDVLKLRLRQVTEGSSTTDAAMTELEQRQKIMQGKTVMLDTFQARYAELTNRAELEEPDARIASRAMPPSKPSFPRPVLFLGVTFAGSLGLSLSLAFFLERFRSGFRSTRQIREALELPTLGIIPQIVRNKRGPSPADTLLDKSDSVYAEAMRSTQIALLNARGTATKKAIMVTSSLPGEGKTAFAVSLGRCLALSERKVLLVDADLRRPTVATQLDAYRVPGLSDLLQQQASLEEVVRHDNRTGLDFVAAGSRIQDPQKLLGDPGLRVAFSRWLSLYDVVLVDTPPVMAAFDAALLAGFCDFAVYVVEWDRTPQRAVEAGIDHLRSFDIPVGGVILSKVDLDRQRQYADYVDFCFRGSGYYAE
jgi:polysaccharide biosynthesis transport protein